MSSFLDIPQLYIRNQPDNIVILISISRFKLKIRKNTRYYTHGNCKTPLSNSRLQDFVFLDIINSMHSELSNYYNL